MSAGLGPDEYGPYAYDAEDDDRSKILKSIHIHLLHKVLVGVSTRATASINLDRD